MFSRNVKNKLDFIGGWNCNDWHWKEESYVGIIHKVHQSTGRITSALLWRHVLVTLLIAVEEKYEGRVSIWYGKGGIMNGKALLMVQ